MIRESVKKLVPTAHQITIKEWNNTPLNTYERQFLYEYLSDETLLKVANEYHKHTTQEVNPCTYNATVVSILFPELIRRLHKTITEKEQLINSHADFVNKKYERLKREVKKFLHNSSWDEYSTRATSVALKGTDINHSVECGTAVFKELAKASEQHDLT